MTGYQLAEVDETNFFYGHPTDQFLKDFPRGVVPIRETRHLMPLNDSAHQALMDTLTVFEYEHKAEEIKAWWYEDNRAERFTRMDWSERAMCRDQVRVWLVQGVSPLTICQQARISMKQMSRMWTDSKYTDRDWQGVWLEIWKGQCNPLAVKFGIKPKGLRNFALLCEAWWTLEQTFDYCYHQLNHQGVPVLHTVNALAAQTPSPQWPYGTVLSHGCRKDKPGRN